MKTLVISDLHSNHQALSAVFSHVRRKRIARVVCLGDFVGYGAEPNQVLDRMRRIRARKLYIRGNHDRVVAGEGEGEDFNRPARIAALWTRGQLSKPNRHFLRALPLGPVEEDGMLLCHGSPDDEDEYVFSELDAARILGTSNAHVVFFGHTHLPMIYRWGANGFTAIAVQQAQSFVLDAEARYLINPGSVGQPRDRNPLASFVIYHPERSSVQFVRIPYDIAATQRSILQAGLPRILADRLAFGY